MAKKKISELTPEEAMDENTLLAFKGLLQKAKMKAAAAQEAENAVFRALDDMCIDPQEVPTSAENADNLAEAISCYLSYGEYSVAGIMKEVRAAYGDKEKP